MDEVNFVALDRYKVSTVGQLVSHNLIATEVSLNVVFNCNAQLRESQGANRHDNPSQYLSHSLSMFIFNLKQHTGV